MLPKDLTTDIKTAKKSIEIEIGGIIKMLDETRHDPEQILTQFKAAQKDWTKHIISCWTGVP